MIEKFATQHKEQRNIEIWLKR